MEFKNFLQYINEAESTAEKDNKAEKAGKKVAKDIEYDEGHKGKDDDKAEKAGKKVTKDIEYDDKKDSKKKKSLKDWFEIIDKNIIAEAEQITMEPAKQNTQVIKQGTKVLGTVSNPQLAAQIKQSIGKGEMSLAGNQMKEELDDLDEKSKNPYAIGMAQAMKSTGDKPPLKKSTIVKAHDIAKKVMKKEAAEDNPESAMLEADVEESGLQAYLGKKKYGKEGMAALQKAGREGASKEKMAQIRAKHEKTDEAEIPSSGPDYGAGLGAGRKDNMLEAKPDFLDLDKDGNKKESMKKAAADKKKQKVKESMNTLEAAYHEGKSHGLSKHGYACRYNEGSEEHKRYHEGFKEGLDECYGLQPNRGLVVSEVESGQDVVDNMASFGAEEGSLEENAAAGYSADMHDKIKNATPKELSAMAFDFAGEMGPRYNHELKKLQQAQSELQGSLGEMDKTAYMKHKAKTTPGDTFSAFGQIHKDSEVLEMDAFAFESLDKQLNELLNEGAETVNEGLSVNMSQGLNDGMGDDSVSVSATGDDAAKLLDFIKQVGLGGLGGVEASAQEPAVVAQISDYGAPKFPGYDDKSSMMDLIKKVSGDDYKDEEQGHDHEAKTCNECGMAEAKCGCEKEKVMGEEQTPDQMTDEMAESDGEGDIEAYGQEAEINASMPAKGGATNEDGAEAPGSNVVGQEEQEEAEKVNEESLSKLDEWANDAGKDGTEQSFERDIEFMTKVISGGLNKPKSTGQTTIPVIAGQEARMGDEDVIAWKKLAGLQK